MREKKRCGPHGLIENSQDAPPPVHQRLMRTMRNVTGKPRARRRARAREPVSRATFNGSSGAGLTAAKPREGAGRASRSSLPLPLPPSNPFPASPDSPPPRRPSPSSRAARSSLVAAESPSVCAATTCPPRSLPLSRPLRRPPPR